MVMKDYLSKKYMNLCQRLGDAQYKMGQLKKTVDSLENELEELNKLVPELDAVQEQWNLNLKTDEDRIPETKPAIDRKPEEDSVETDNSASTPTN